MDARYRRLTARARQHGGFWLRRDAMAAGFSDGSVSEHVASGRWVVWFDHVYSPAAMPDTWDQRIRAAYLRVGSDAVVTGRSAARLWELAGFEDSEALESSSHGSTPRVSQGSRSPETPRYPTTRS